MTLVKTDDKRFYRDMKSKALVSVDRGAADEYIAKRNMLNEQKQLRKDVDDIQATLAEILNILKGTKE